MKKLFIAFAMFTFNFAFGQTQEAPIRGLRVDVSYFYSLYPGQSARQAAVQVVKTAKAGGVNTLFVYAYNSVYGAFYPTVYPGTVVENGYGTQNILTEITLAAKASGMKTVAVVPVNNFKTLWTAHADWRVKNKAGADYLPAADQFLLSAWHPDFRTWLAGFYRDLLKQNPELYGIEAVEPYVDYNWAKEADYNPVSEKRFKSLNPGAVDGDQKWLNFRAQGLTELIAMLTTAANGAGKKSFLVQTWPAKPDGSLFSSQVIKDNIGLDLDTILNFTGAKKLNYLMAEMMWQQWAAEYGAANFPVSWTRTAAKTFISYVGSRSQPLLHVEVSNFSGAVMSVTPSMSEFSETLRSIKDLKAGIDVYDYYQLQIRNGWASLLSWN